MLTLVNHLCLNCGTELNYRNLTTYLCDNCVSKITQIDFKTACPKCGLPNSQRSCYFCQTHILKTKRNISMFEYKGFIRDLIHAVKFNNQKHKVSIIKRLTDKVDLDEIFKDTIDIIVPVPTSIKSLVRRGFDFVKLVFFHISKRNNKPFVNLLGRKTFHKEQKKLSIEERMIVVKKQFFIRKRVNLSGKNVLIVDDVFTTGSTVNACTELIETLNPKSVYSLTLARVPQEID